MPRGPPSCLELLGALDALSNVYFSMSRLSICVLATLLSSCVSVFQVDPHAQSRIEEGKAQLDQLVADPAAQGCWSKAVAALESGCRSMDDQRRSRLAVQFTNCHMEKSLLPTYACTESMDIAQCTRPMVDSVNSIAYSAYTTFYTHAESMCFYLQSEAFQRATEQAVDRLHASAKGTAAQLGELQAQAGHIVSDTMSIRNEQQAAAEAAQKLLEGQRKASAELGELAEQQAHAFAQAEISVQRLGGESQAALLEIKRGAEEIGSKQGLLLGGLDRVLSLQGSVLGEFLDVKTVFVYTSSVLLSLALTSTKPTASARLPLFALLTANLMLERLLATWLCPGATRGAAPAESVASLHGWIGLLRRIAGALALAVLLHAVFHHTDASLRTLSTLDELKRMHQEHSDEMQSRLERLEREAAAIRRKESTTMMLAARALKAGGGGGGTPHRRALSPAEARGAVLGSGGRRHLSPLAAAVHKSKSPTSSKKRSSRSPLSGAGKSAAGDAFDGTDGTSSSAFDVHATAATSMMPPPPPPSDTTCTQPPSPPPEEAEEASESSAAAAPSATLASLAASGLAPLHAVAAAVGATPAARKARGRRSSVGSTETDSLTPTRRSARLANKMAKNAPADAK